MSGYRIWPAMLLAVLGGIGAAAITLADSSGPAEGTCADGQEWAAVTAVQESSTGDDALLMEYRQRFQPIFVGCLDVDAITPLDPADVPDPRS